MEAINYMNLRRKSTLVCSLNGPVSDNAHNMYGMNYQFINQSITFFVCNLNLS